MGKNVKCCAISCTNSRLERPDLTFFQFPSYDMERSWEWIVNMGRTDLLGTERNILRRLFICSAHFETHCFKSVMTRRLLTRTAVPTVFNHYIPDHIEVHYFLASLNRLQNEDDVESYTWDGWTQDDTTGVMIQCSQKCVQTVNEGSKAAVLQTTTNQKFPAENQLHKHELGSEQITEVVQYPDSNMFNCTANGNVFRHEVQMHAGNLNSRETTFVLGNLEKQCDCSLCQTFFSSKAKLTEHGERNHNLHIQVEELGEVVKVDSCEADTQEYTCDTCVQEIGKVKYS